MQPRVSISGLTIRFPEQSLPAVDNISLDIFPGEILALVGESGSGKSLTALTLPGLLPSQAIINGTVTGFFPEAVNLLDKKNQSIVRGKEIGMIFQEPMTALNPVFTCGYQVMESLILHKKMNSRAARAETIKLFEKTGLPDPAGMLHRYPHQLSGGQRQRVMIAMAMAAEPRLLIADEPTTALDVRVQAGIMNLLLELQQENGMSILLITHDLNMVARYAHRVAVMEKGKIVETGSTQQVLHHPLNAYTKKLISSRVAHHPKTHPLPTDDLERSGPWKLPEPGKEMVRGESITVNFKEKKGKIITAVNGVSFSIRENEIVGLVGESGSGKSTLGKTILQLQKQNAGRVFFNGEELSVLQGESLRKQRKNFQVVFQDPYGSLNPQITAGEAIREAVQWHHPGMSSQQSRERVNELLKMVHLPGSFYDRYPHQFSGGQRQRISIARALATDPRFLVFDESVSALDITVQAQILNLVQELRETVGFTALFISHDLAVVHYLCDRIMVMKDGVIVEEGSSEKIFHHPDNEYTKELLAAMKH